ncbi:hypothetical protein MMC17_006444 [Xylographa soralifera]|nr:hypothetical protein [Xylographa soralifera]
MWNRVLGLSNEKRENPSSSSSRRKDDDEKRPERKRTTSTRKSSGTEERDRGIDSTFTNYYSSSRAPDSGVASASVVSSYATAQSNNTDETILPPQQVGNSILVSEMPKSQSGREAQGREDDRERGKARKKDRSTSRNRKEDRQNRSRSRDREERRRDRKEKREKRQEREGPKDSALKKSESDYQGTNRAGEAASGSGNFNAQVGGSGFTQFPGQFDGAVPGFPSGPTHPPHMSDHVPDQFPGQFPTGSSAPYRPPLSVEQGGPGLAAEYYGDAGESVATQPGVRPQAPTLIVGAQPHLMAASPVEAPPAEPSSTGGVGAAASFFSGATFESPSGTPKYDHPPGRPTGIPSGAPPQPPYSGQSSSFAVPAALAGTAALGYIASTHEETPHGPAQGSTSNSAGSFPPQISTRPPSNTYPTASMPPNNNNYSSSAPVIPTLGSAAIGAAAGYMMGSHSSQQQQQQPINPPLPIQGTADYRPPNAQHPSQQMDTPQGSYPGYDRPPQPGKQSPSSSNLPLYAAGALGAAGLAAAAYHHEHHELAQNSYTGQSQPSAFMPQQHRHSGPLSKFVDFFRDPEGVAQFEEYSEYIGVCRYCFALGSSPREAPRKHYYRRKRSNERLGASKRVDKESRYSSTDSESRRRNKNTSWIASGIAGMGLAKVGESLFASNHDFDDTYSVRSGRVNQSTASLNGRRYNSSPNQKGSISHGVVTAPSNLQYTDDKKRRSTYKDQETGIGEAALVAAMGAASIAESSSRKRSRSPRGTFIGSKPRSRERDYDYGSERLRKDRKGHSQGSAYIEVTRRNDNQEKGPDSKKKKKKKAGFFNFSNSSSSDTGLVAHTGSDRSKAKKLSRTKIKDHNDANAALIGLGAAAAALAAAEGRKSDKGKRRADVIAVKEVKVKDGRRPDERQSSSQKPTYSNMDEAQWESASEVVGYSSVDSALAYGVSRRRSNDSFHSDFSGTEKWGWRWGSGSSKRKDKPKQESRLTETIVGTAAGLAGATAEASIFANEDPRHAARSSNSSLPPLQHVYPVATSDPSHYDVTRHDSVTSGNQPMRTSRAAAIPLQQPQPVMPVSSVIYDHSYSAPAGPPVFSQPPQPSSFVPGYGVYNAYVDVRQGIVPMQHTSEQAVMAAVPQAVGSERKLRRRESSPTPEIIHIEPKQPKRSSTRDDMSAVRFELTEEQRNKEFRDRERERERKNSDLLARDEELHYVNENVNTEAKPRRSKKGSRSDDISRRDEQINSELQSFRKPDDTPTKQKDGNAWVTPVLVGMAGAVIGAAATQRVPDRDKRRDAQSNAKPDDYEEPIVIEDNKKKQLPDVEDEDQISHDERQKALAKKAAELVKRTPSPAHQDYSSFFAPTEFLSKSKKKTIVDDSNGGNDITTYPVPEIVTNEPLDQRGPPSSVPYTFPSADEEGDFDPNFMRLPWQVPRLNLIKPTPPASMAGSVRGDASPILRPEDAHTSDNEEQKQSEKDSKRVKVSFGESETHEYEVVTPEDHRDEFIKDLLEDRTTEQKQPIDEGVPVASSQRTESPFEEVTRDHVPGDFGDDLDFAATLAAGLQGSGFDPAIVIDDPTYRRRDSPPGSEDRDFYRRPFFETVEDLSLDSPGTEGAPPQRGFVEGEIPPTPKDELPAEFIRPAEDGKDNSKVVLTEAKTVKESNDNVKMLQKEDGYRESYHDSEVPHIIEVVPRSVLDDYSGSPVDQRPHSNEPSSDFSYDKEEFQDASEFALTDNGSRELPDVRPEAGDALEAEADFISTKKRNKQSKVRGKNQVQDIYDAPDDDSISKAATAPLPDEFEDQKRSKRKSKGRTSEYNDAGSAVSSPASFDTEKNVHDELGNGKVGLVSSVMNLTNQSADQDIEREPEKAREATLDDFVEPKKKGKKSKGSQYKADEEWFKVEAPELTSDLSKVEEEEGNRSQRSSSKRDKRKKNGRSNGNEDSGMVTQGIPAENGNLDKEKDTISLQHLDDHDPNRGIPRSNELDQPLSFLGMRREITEPPDITSTLGLGSTVRRISSEETFRDAIRSKIIEQGLPPLPASRPTSPTAVGSTGDLPSLPPSRTASPVATPGEQRRRLSMLQLAESNHGGSSPSPTAVPLIFRRFPSSTGVSRSNPSSPGPSPRTAAPFSPRQRQGRPLSTEFKSSTEFRPLWLLERHNPSRRSQGPEAAEETYPSLPSSHSTSRASSVHNADFEDSDETHENNAFDKDVTVPHEVPFSLAHNFDHTDDFLDSQQPTPTRDSFTELETRSIDPMQHLSSQSVRSTPREHGPKLDLLEHEKNYPENLPSLPRSRESSPYEETASRDNISTATGVTVGAMAAGTLASMLDSTLRSDQDYDLHETRTRKRELDDNFRVPETEHSRSESDFVVTNDGFEPFATPKDKKRMDKQQRETETIAAADKGVPDDIPVFEAVRLDGRLQDAQVENKPVREAELVRSETMSSSTPSQKSKKDKRDKGKSKSRSRSIDTPDFDVFQPERTADFYGQGQRHKTAFDGTEFQPKPDEELPILSENAIGSVAVTAAAAAAAEVVLNAESSKIPAISILPLENDDWPNFSTKSKKGKNQRGKKTSEFFDEQLPASTLSIQEVEDLDSDTRNSENVKEEDFFDIPSSKRSKKAKKNRKSGLARELEENPTGKSDQGKAAMVSKDIEVPTTPSKIPESVYQDTMPEPGTIDGKLGAVKSLQVEMVSPEAIALPADDDLELLPSLPPDIPLSEPQSPFDIVAEERDLSKELTSTEDAYPMTTLYDSPTMASEIHPPRDVTGSPTHDMEISPEGERRSFVESSEALRAFAENPHEHFSHEDTAVKIDEASMMRDPVPGSSDLEQQDNLELVHPTKAFVEQQESQGSRELELTKNHSSEQKRDMIDVGTPTANTSTDHFLTTVGEASTPYEEPLTSMFDTHTQDTETADGYFNNVRDKDEEVLYPTIKRSKNSKKGRKSQPVTPLEEPFLAERSITDSLGEASASVLEVFSGKNSKAEFSVVDEPATDEWAISLKKKGKRGRKSQPTTPFEELPSTGRSIVELPDEASASLEDKVFENVSQKALAVADEPATDEWPISSKKKGKKGKKSQPITPLEELSLAERLIVGTPSDSPFLAQESIPDVVSKEPTFGDDLAIDEWATTSKQKGKKSKKKNNSYEEADPSRDDQKEVKDIADVRDFGDANQRSLETSNEPTIKQADFGDQEKLMEHDGDYLTSAADFPLATTNTAKEVSNMLGSAKKDSAIDDGQSDSRDVLRELPEPEAQVSSEAIEQEEDDWAGYAKRSNKKSKKAKTSFAASLANADLVEDGKREKDHSVAITDTAAEVRNMLTSTDDVGEITPTQELNQFSDDGFSGFTTKTKGKKGGRKNTVPRLLDLMPLNDIPPTTVSNLEDASTESNTGETESTDTFSVPKSKKDKKSKRKAMSRSASDYQDASESSGMVTECAVDPNSISSITMVGSNQDSLIDKAASVKLPSQVAHKLGEEDTLHKELISSPIEAPVQRFDTTSIDEASNIALPTEEREDLEEREEDLVGPPHTLKHDPDHKHSKSESGRTSQPPPTEALDTNSLMEAIRLPLPEDFQNDFIESSKLDRDMVPSIEGFPTNATELSDAVPTQPNTKNPAQPLARGFDIASDIPVVQYPVALHAEENNSAVDQDRYGKNLMGSENFGEEEGLSNIRPTLGHSRSELEELPAVHMEAPLSLADGESKPLKDKIEVLSRSGFFTGQSEDTATIPGEATDASPAFVEQNDLLIDDDDFLRLNKTKKDEGKMISSTSDWTEEPAAESGQENLTEESAQSTSTSRELESNLPAEPESVASINNEGFFASKKGKKDKKKKKSSFQSWEDEPAEQAIEEPLAEAPTQSDSVSRDLVDPIRPELGPMMTIEDDGFSVSKKSKKGKKNRKSSTLDSTREPSPLPEMDRELGTTPVFDSLEVAAAETEVPSRLTTDEQAIATGEDSLFDLPKGKKGKKKAKKLQAIDWADEPANIAAPPELDTSASTVDPVEALPIDRQGPPLFTAEEHIATANDDNLFDLPNGKKSMEISEKSQALNSLDETAAAPALIDPGTTLPTFRTAETLSIERGEPPAMNAEEQSVITSTEDDPFVQLKGKKGKKKSKNSQAIDWNNEPTNVAAPTESYRKEDVTPTELQVPEMERTASQSPVEEPEPGSFSLKKSKKDKKKAKKGTRFAWDEEPAQETNQVEDDTVAKELSEIPLGKDILQAGIEEAKPRESHEDKIGGILDSSEREIVSPTKLPGDDADKISLSLGDKNDDREVYPAFGLEEGVVHEPDDIRVLRPVEESEDTHEPSHQPGDIQKPQSIGFNHGQETFYEPVARFETGEFFEPGTVNESEAVPQPEPSIKPESALDPTLVKDLESPIRRESFDIATEPGNGQKIEQERANLPDIVEPQEDELFLPFQTKKKKKKGKGSGQATPSKLEIREESAPLVDEEPLLTLEDIGLDRERKGVQPNQSLEKSLKESVYEEKDPREAGTSLISEPERAIDMLEPSNIETPVAEDEFSGFTMKKKNKKGKKSQQAVDSRFEEPLAQPANSLEEEAVEPVTEERNRDMVEASSYVPERTADSFQVKSQESPVAEDDFASFATRKKGKKGKKSRQSEDPIYEVPAMEGETQEPPNPQDESIQDDDFAGFATKKKKGKKSGQSANRMFEEPPSDTAIMQPELLEESREIGEGSSTYEQERRLDMLDIRNRDTPDAEDDFEGFATKKGKKGKKSPQARDINLEEPPTVLEELQVPIAATEKGSPEVVEPFAKSHELSSTIESDLKPAESTLPSKEEDDWAGFGTIKPKRSKKGKKEQPIVGENETTTYRPDEVAPYQGESTETQATKSFETTETSASHIQRDNYQPSHLGEDIQLAAIPTDFSDLVEPNEVSSRELGPEESGSSTMEDRLKHHEFFKEHRLQAPLTLDTSRPSDGSNTETAFQRHLQSDEAYDNPPLDHLAKFHERQVFAYPEPSSEEQTDNFLEFPTREMLKKSEKGLGESSFADESIPKSRSPTSPYNLAEAMEESSVLYPETLLPQPLVEGDSDHQNDLDRGSRAVATEEGSLEYTQSFQRGPGIRENLSRGQTEDARQEATALELNAEGVPDVLTRKKSKKGKKSNKQYLDLEQTSSTTDLHGDQSISDRERSSTDLADAVVRSRNKSSMNDVPVAQPQDTREHEVEQEYSMSRGQERNIEPRESRNIVKPLVAATAVGASIALFEDLARRDSISARQKDKKRKKKSDQFTEWEEEDQGEAAMEQSSGLPSTAEYHESLDKSSFSEGQPRALSPQYDAPRYRDSAIHVADSPIPSAKSPLHYSIRDSGYQGNDASPTLQEVLALPRQNRLSTDSTSRGAEHEMSPIRHFEQNPIDQSHQTATQFHEKSHNPLNISIEVDPAYDISISRPVQEHEARREASLDRSRELEVELPASYPEHHEHHEVFNSASPVRHYDDRQPSPVDSTTRDRSSVLFQSSPSTREDNIHTQPLSLSSEHTTERTRNLEMPRHLDEIPSPTRSSKRPEPSAASVIEGTKTPQSSLFGGPIGVNSDLRTIISPPGTPNSSSRRQFDSMSEYGLGDSPLQEKSRRISDRSVQEPSVQGIQQATALQWHSQQRVRSPLGNYTEDKEPVSTDDIISRLPWPTVDEENHSADLHRSKNRNPDTAQRSSSRHSPLPALAIDVAKQREPDFRSVSGASIRSGESISAYIRSPDVQSPATPPLRRVDRSVSGDLRAANKRGGANALAKHAETEVGRDTEPGFASSSTYDPATDKGKERITKMTDVYEGWGDVHGSPRSPTRPPSMRKRQSMQLLDLETRIDQLVSENRLLQDAKARADRQLGDAVQDHGQQKSAFDDAIRTRDLYIQQKNSELNELRGILDGLQSEVSRLTEINEGLSGPTRELTSDHEQRYGQLEDAHADVHQKWQESTRELEDLRQQHASLSSGMEGIVRHEVDLALESKDVELRQMRNELETAKDQVRRLQQQILASRSSDDIIVVRDEDYFDSQCQQLCQHVQQWVLRFSKFSDMKPCLSIDDVADERISDRFDNAILDGSDVDIYLADRIKRRDVFMSVVMTMVWEYIFQRYLFGMDREQRQKLKSLEKTLSEVGPARAVNKWRATTLTMLARRESFLAQRQQDTEAVVREIFDTLAVLLPPPGHLVGQITDSLRKVMTTAVDLAIEMRCQLCEYIMPPPLQPEYDTHGDLARQVFFNAALMNERSGATASNDELSARHAVVRLVLFPLLLKKGDDDGEGDEEIVVCPAQVLVARDSEPRPGKKSVRVVSAQSQRAEAMSLAGQSVQSFAPSSMDAGMGSRF